MGILKAIDYMFIFVPISIILAFLNFNPVYVFLTCILSIVPLSKHIGKVTENIALQTTPTMGALVNVTFGNSIELIIAALALQAGLLDLVKASITGSVIISLLLIGMAMFFGGLRYKEQSFSSKIGSVSSTMLIIAIIGVSIPTIYFILTPAAASSTTSISLSVSVVIAIIYLLGLVFTFVTHKHLFDLGDELKKEKIKPTITKRKAIGILALLTLVVFIEAEILVSAVKPATEVIGLTEVFVGVVIIGIITNISELINAVSFALKDKMELSMEIGTNSATQIALFVVPVLVLISSFFTSPLNLVFPLFDIAALFFTVLIINHLITDGRCNWLEGAQLITVYIILAIAFFFV